MSLSKPSANAAGVENGVGNWNGLKVPFLYATNGEIIWFLDARSNVPGITKKDRPLSPEHFAEFEKCYGSDPNGLSKRKDLRESGRFRPFEIAALKARDFKLDITWLKDESLEDSDELPEPQELALEAITKLDAVTNDLKKIISLIEKEEGVGKLSG